MNNLPLPRRQISLSVLLAGMVASVSLTPSNALAQATDFPTRPIRMVVPFGAGTTTDTVARIVAEAMGKSLGQTVLVENRAGGGGSIGSDLVAKAPADGYLLVMGTVGTHAINKSLFKSLPYDPLRDFAPLALVGQTPTLLVVGANSPFATLKDLAAAANKAPGVNFASAGNGTSGHLAGELLKKLVGGQMVHVPYKEGGQAVTDVIGGQAHFMFYHPAAVVPHMKAGKLRALGASSKDRSATVPEVPTIAEQVNAKFDLVAWFMLYAPAATPAPVLAKLRAAGEAALSNPEVAARLTAQGLEKSNVPANELGAFGQTEIAKWAELVKQSGAQVD
jgi:tripartite-type tricarboxylate transporter receptor subunit TctC